MEVQLDAVRTKIHTLLLNCDWDVIDVSPELPLPTDDDTYKGRIQASCHPKNSPDRIVDITVRIYDKWSSVFISDSDATADTKKPKSFRGDDAIEQVLTFIKNTLLEL